MNQWCNNIKCRKHHDNFEVVEINKNKSGRYYPYRDTMDSEKYTYTEVVLKCLVCGDCIKVKKDTEYEMSESDMEKYGYRGANYGG